MLNSVPQRSFQFKFARMLTERNVNTFPNGHLRAAHVLDCTEFEAAAVHEQRQVDSDALLAASLAASLAAEDDGCDPTVQGPAMINHMELEAGGGDLHLRAMRALDCTEFEAAAVCEQQRVDIDALFAA